MLLLAPPVRAGGDAMADSPDEKQNEDSGADIGDDDGSINDL